MRASIGGGDEKEVNEMANPVSRIRKPRHSRHVHLFLTRWADIAHAGRTEKGGGEHMNILLWIVFGAIAGWIASAIMGSGGGAVADVVLGIIGAVVGGFVMNILGAPGVSGLNLYSLVVAIIGAVILIYIGRLLRTV